MHALFDSLIEAREKARQNPFDLPPQNSEKITNLIHYGTHMGNYTETISTQDEVNLSHEEAVKKFRKLMGYPCNSNNNTYIQEPKSKKRTLTK